MTEINLETGKVEGEDEPAPKRGPGRPRKDGKPTGSGEPRKRSHKSGANVDAEIASRTRRVIRRMADRTASHGDDELATAMREDGPTIAQGVADITKVIIPLRAPLLILLAIIEPAIAFLRVGGILAARIARRRPVVDTVLAPNGAGAFHLVNAENMVVDAGPFDEYGNRLD
jgi:hypothetical protein